VADNLNAHKVGALCEVFCVEEARRLLNRFEWHFAPNHGSWLDMVEIEIGVMCRQVLGVAFVDMESFERQVKAWIQQRNVQCVKVNWQFTTKDARIKLKRLYPTII
ncbi:MAG: IS630 family transposase, partial [Candidatus Bathyarchaeota archaeon]|nr:IS630 family transposase [Candidatus Termiticorpusculum sp.]